MIKHLSFTLVIFSWIMVSAAEYSLDDVTIEVKAESDSFFDRSTLATLAQVNDADLIDLTAKELNDFFVSTGIHFESQGRFTVLKKGAYSGRYMAPSHIYQKQPMFEIEMPATEIFLRPTLNF